MRTLRRLPALVVIATTTLPFAAAPLCGLLRPGMAMHGEMSMPGMPDEAAASWSPVQPTGNCDFARCASGPTAPVMAFTSVLPVLPVNAEPVLAPAGEPSADPAAPLTPPPQA